MEPPKWSFEKVGQVLLIQSIDSSKKQILQIIPLCKENENQTDISNNSDSNNSDSNNSDSNNSDSNNSFFQFYDFQFYDFSFEEIPQFFFDIHNIFS
jgi:hypothetical protein